MISINIINEIGKEMYVNSLIFNSKNCPMIGTKDAIIVINIGNLYSFIHWDLLNLC